MVIKRETYRATLLESAYKVRLILVSDFERSTSFNNISIYSNDTIHACRMHNDAGAWSLFYFSLNSQWFCFQFRFSLLVLPLLPLQQHFHSLRQFCHLNSLQLRRRFFFCFAYHYQSKTVTNYRVSICLNSMIAINLLYHVY